MHLVNSFRFEVVLNKTLQRLSESMQGIVKMSEDIVYTEFQVCLLKRMGQ